jgi:hypothetical protein
MGTKAQAALSIAIVSKPLKDIYGGILNSKQGKP